MTPAKKCKELGINGLKELSELSGVSYQTLSNWAKDKPKLFNIILKGVYFEKTLNYFIK